MRLLRDCDIRSDVVALADRPDYKWMRENIGAVRKAGVRLSHGKGWMDAITLQFAREWPPSLHGIQDPLDLVLPHFAKAIEINRQFALLRARYQAALAALDHVAIGTCIAAPSGQVIVANREARAIFDMDDGIVLRAGILSCQLGQVTARLAAGIHAVSATASGEGVDSEILIFCERPSGKQPFMIELAPLRDSTAELEKGLHGAIIFVIDPENQRCISTDRLARLFSLTDAESEVSRLMIGGHSASEIAELRGVAEETVKSQFKSVYAKSGVHRRADLLRLALTIDPPIGRCGGASLSWGERA